MSVLDCSRREGAQLSPRTTRVGADTCVLRASAAALARLCSQWRWISERILFSAHAAPWPVVAPRSGMTLPSRTRATSISSQGVTTRWQGGTATSRWATPIASSRVTEAGARVRTATSRRGSIRAAEMLASTLGCRRACRRDTGTSARIEAASLHTAPSRARPQHH